MMKVKDDGNGGGNVRNGNWEEEAKYVEMGTTEEKTAIGTHDDTNVVSQNIRQVAQVPEQ